MTNYSAPPPYLSPPPKNNTTLWIVLGVLGLGCFCIAGPILIGFFYLRSSLGGAMGSFSKQALARQEARQIENQIDRSNYGATRITFEPKTDYGKAFKAYCESGVASWNEFLRTTKNGMSLQTIYDAPNLASAEAIRRSEADIDAYGTASGVFADESYKAVDALAIAYVKTFGPADWPTAYKVNTQQYHDATIRALASSRAVLDFAMKDPPVPTAKGGLKWHKPGEQAEYERLRKRSDDVWGGVMRMRQRDEMTNQSALDGY